MSGTIPLGLFPIPDNTGHEQLVYSHQPLLDICATTLHMDDTVPYINARISRGHPFLHITRLDYRLPF